MAVCISLVLVIIKFQRPGKELLRNFGHLLGLLFGSCSQQIWMRDKLLDPFKSEAYLLSHYMFVLMSSSDIGDNAEELVFGQEFL